MRFNVENLFLRSGKLCGKYFGRKAKNKYIFNVVSDDRVFNGHSQASAK